MKAIKVKKCVLRQQNLTLLVFMLIGLFGASTRIGLTNANVINDMNNMLRDATPAVSNNMNGVRQRSILRNAPQTTPPQVKEVAQKLEDLVSTTQVKGASRQEEDGGMEDENSFGDFSEETSAELLRFVDDIELDEKQDKSQETNNQKVAKTTRQPKNRNFGLEEQVRLLTKQLNALTTRRREDYELLERNLRKSLKITTNAASVDNDIRNEFDQLRREVKSLHDGHINGKKERLTVEWLQQSVAEIRKQLVELQHIASSTSKDMSHRAQTYEDLATIRNDFAQLKLEVTALKERQQTNEIFVRELREEVLQQEEEYRHFMNHQDNILQQKKETAHTVIASATNSSISNEMDTPMLASHNRRHCRFQRQQIHELQLVQRSFKHQLNELKYHRIDERVRSIEIEQHRIADANFNLSRQIASLDKLHSSMLELLEDVEGLQNKMDKSIPDFRHEISKLEFTNAQLTSEQSLMREEGKNVARSVQAMAVSISTLQEEREGVKQMQNKVTQLQTNVDRLQSMVQDIQRALVHKNKFPMGKHHQHEHAHNHSKDQSLATTLHPADQPQDQQQLQQQQQQGQGEELQIAPMSLHAESLVAKLENVEQQYESIINKLPSDCSAVSTGNINVDGLYLIAPAGQHRPLMAHCNNEGWTTVQRRFDGSADFNRSWEDYSVGFGVPSGEYWIGNEQLHHLTLNNCSSLRILMQDIYDNVWVAEYAYFYVSSRDDGYRLHVAEYSGNASDALDYQQGMQFSAIDVDRDISQTHCAANYEGGWWFSHCQHANLNGRYNLGLTWFDAGRNEWIAVKSSHMLVKSRHHDNCLTVKSAVTATERDTVTGDTKFAPATTTIPTSKLLIVESDLP